MDLICEVCGKDTNEVWCAPGLFPRPVMRCKTCVAAVSVPLREAVAWVVCKGLKPEDGWADTISTYYHDEYIKIRALDSIIKLQEKLNAERKND